MLQKRWKDCLTLEGDFVDEQNDILPKTMFLLVSQSGGLLNDSSTINWF